MKDLATNINCPNCGRKVNVKVNEMIPGRMKRLSCGCTIQFSGDDGREIQRALNKIEKQIKQLNKKITIKI